MLIAKNCIYESMKSSLTYYFGLPKNASSLACLGSSNTDVFVRFVLPWPCLALDDARLDAGDARLCTYALASGGAAAAMILQAHVDSPAVSRADRGIHCASATFKSNSKKQKKPADRANKSSPAAGIAKSGSLSLKSNRIECTWIVCGCDWKTAASQSYYS